ncbi:MAG: hypothetical protein KA144_12430 [Xanthomonadaceae bacterium]|nr:hypothetical protein [Xanthomonadaceae bacterium]MCC7248926.1 hypothetical protein [Lysobacter sp.]
MNRRRITVLSLIVALACFESPAHAQEGTFGVTYDGDIESLKYSVERDSLSNGRIWLRLHLKEMVGYDWRAKRALKTLWEREASIICRHDRITGRPKPFGPVASCDGVTADGRRTGDCGVWAGIAGTLKCKR